MDDTSPEVHRLIAEHLRNTPPWRKAQMIMELQQMGETFSAAGQRLRHPGISDREIRARIREARLGPELARAVAEHLNHDQRRSA